MTKLFFIGSVVTILGIAIMELSEMIYTRWSDLIDTKQLELIAMRDDVDNRIEVLAVNGPVDAMDLNQLGADIFKLKVDGFKIERDVYAFINSSWQYTMLMWVSYMAALYGFSLVVIVGNILIMKSITSK